MSANDLADRPHIGTDEAQRLLNAAMGDADDGNTGDELFDMFVGDNNVVVWPDGDHVATVFPPVMTGSNPHALACLFAAAPRLAAEVVRLNDLLRVQAEQLDTLRNAIGDPNRLRVEFDPPLPELSNYLRRIADAVDALAAAGGGVPNR